MKKEITTGINNSIDPCKKHKKYRAIEEPNRFCLGCWKYYLSKHPCNVLTNIRIIKVIFALENEMANNKKI